MKRVFVFLLVLLACLISVCAFAEQEGLFSYKVNDDNTVTITGFDWQNNSEDIEIPDQLNNRVVSAIGELAFATTDNKAASITLPDSIRSIGAQAFRGASIKYVNIPLSTVEIGSGAFAQCSVMRFNVADGHSVFATIDNALYNKQLKMLIAWPENKEIGEVPKGIVIIGDYAFYGRSFSSDYKKQAYSLPATVKAIGEYAFAKTSNISLDAKNVETVGAHAFEESDLEMKSDQLSVIDDYAFYKAKINFKTRLSLSIIGEHAFEESKVYFVAEENTNHYVVSATPYVIKDYAFYKSDGGKLVLTNVTSIGSHAFEDTNSNNNSNALWLLKDDLKELSYLGESAFTYSCIYTCGNDRDGYHAYVDLTNEALEAIPDSAFSQTAITDLRIGPSVKSIGDYAFNDCPFLNHVELSEGLLTIGNRAFSNCAELETVSIPASVTEIGSRVFKDCPDTLVITVEAGSYGEEWVQSCGFAYVINGKEEDTSWLND